MVQLKKYGTIIDKEIFLKEKKLQKRKNRIKGYMVINKEDG